MYAKRCTVYVNDAPIVFTVRIMACATDTMHNSNPLLLGPRMLPHQLGHWLLRLRDVDAPLLPGSAVCMAAALSGAEAEAGRLRPDALAQTACAVVLITYAHDAQSRPSMEGHMSTHT